MRGRLSPIVVVGLALTGGCLALQLSDCRLAQTLSNHFQDFLTVRLCRPARSQQVAVVTVDEKSLGELGQWPWPRHVLADLTRRIFAQGASVVAFDVLFAEPDRSSPAAVERDLKHYLGVEAQVTGVPAGLRDYDALFAAAIAGQNVILGCEMAPDNDARMPMDAGNTPDPHYRGTVVCVGKGDGRQRLLHAAGAVLPLPELAAQAHTAFFNAVPDDDNKVRRNPLVWVVGAARVYPALALEAVRLHRHPDVASSLVRYDEYGAVSVDIGATSIPVDHAGRCVLNYRAVTTDRRTGLSGSFPSYPAVDVLRGAIATNALTGRIVLIGASAVALKDIKATPLTQFFSGVEVHATMIDNILAGDVLRRPNWMSGADAVTLLLIGLFLTFCIARGRAWLSLAVTLAVLVGSGMISYICVERAALLVLPTWSMMCVALVYPALTTMRFWDEERQKYRVRKMFGTMVSAKVLRYLENHPENFSLRGVKTEATVFFSDVRGFTTISESLPPEQLTDLLNRYLSPMTEIIMQCDGYVDKYEGDAIMAEWGVPFAIPDHAVKACQAALDQQAALAALRADGH